MTDRDLKETNADTLYKKVGRKYVPVATSVDWARFEDDILPIGKFRLMYSCKEGGRRYYHGVTPDTAGWHAAAMLARTAMEEAIQKAAISSPQVGRGIPYTKRQRAIIEEFRQRMAQAGGFMPQWWESASAASIADAAIDAVLRHVN